MVLFYLRVQIPSRWRSCDHYWLVEREKDARRIIRWTDRWSGLRESNRIAWFSRFAIASGNKQRSDYGETVGQFADSIADKPHTTLSFSHSYRQIHFPTGRKRSLTLFDPFPRRFIAFVATCWSSRNGETREIRRITIRSLCFFIGTDLINEPVPMTYEFCAFNLLSWSVVFCFLEGKK